MSSLPVPPRLFVIFAESAHEAVIFRRGPARWCHVVRWDTMHDTFFRGAWFKGRIYPEKCDLSPDGRLLLYFAHQGSRVGTNYTTAWTAISRSPWLTAIGLWPQGTTYGGGGRFTDNRSAMIRASGIAAHPDHPGTGLSITSGNAPCHVSSSEIADAEWSGRDQNGRLVFTRNGLLMHRKGKEDICLADFTGYTPDPQPAPPWADRPLRGVRQAAIRRKKRKKR